MAPRHPGLLVLDKVLQLLDVLPSDLTGLVAQIVVFFSLQG